MGDCIAMPNHIIDADIPMANGQHPKKPGNWGRGESRSLQNFYSELIDARILRPHLASPQKTIIPSLPPLLHPGPLLIPHGRGRRYKMIIAGGGRRGSSSSRQNHSEEQDSSIPNSQG